MQENQDFYNAWAKNYDFDDNSTIFADEKTFPQIYMARKINKCLEIGCGTGRHIARLESISNQLFAIDLSQNMLEIAKKKSKKSNTKFIHGDIFDLDFAQNEKFDLIIMSLVLEHIKEIAPIFQKIEKLLNNNARFCLSEIHPSRMLACSGARFIDPKNNVEIRGKSFCHGENDIEKIASQSNLELSIKTIAYGNSEYENFKPEWQKYFGKPMILIYEFTKP